MIKYSVVIPLYNKAHTIGRTLQTVLNQKYSDFEVVIINDGSTDDGVNLIEHNFIDTRIRIINQENQGVSAARNRGIQESKGEFIAFLDGDDEWHSDYLQTIDKMTDLYPDAGLYLMGGLIHNANGSVSYRLVSKYLNKISQINLFESPELYTHTSASVYRKSTLCQTHKFLSKMCKYEDILVACSVALKTDVVYCGIPLSKYNGGIDGQLTQMNVKNREKALYSMSLFFNQLIQNSCTNLKQKKYVLRYLKYIFRHALKLAFLQKDEDTINVYLKNKDFRLCKYLMFIEKKMYVTMPSCISILYINYTKMLYRCWGYPIVGNEQIDPNKISSQYQNW